MKKDMKSQFNEMIVLSEDKKTKKGGGINAVLKLMSETIDFNDKILACVEAQDLAENKAAIEKFSSTIEQLYSSLSEIASGGIRSLRDEGAVTEEAPKPEQKSSEPVMVNAPRIPSM